MLDKQLEAILAHAREAGAPDLCDLPPVACRGLYRQILAAADVAPADVDVSDRTIDGPGGPLDLRVYTPRREVPHGIVVYYHGGGFVLGDLDGYDNVCRQLSDDAGAVIVSIDYRLAPEHPFPAAVDDAWAAFEWVATHAAELCREDARVAVAGDSAGASLAAVTSLTARDRKGPAIALQALVYPPAAAGVHGDYPSRTRYADGPTLTLRSIEYFNRHYFGEGAVPADYRAAPLLAADLSGLPPTLLQVATFDALRDEALAYGDRLLEAGNAVIAVEYHGLAHGFISMGGGVSAARLAQRQLAQALRDALR